MNNLVRLAMFAATLCVSLAAHAQSWPTRPVRLIVPTGPGAATDVMARLLAEGITRGLGQSVVVENMPGASGLLAHQSVARAQPDGYTLLFTNTSGMAINPVSFKQLPYDPTKDFTAVAMVSSLGPQMLSINVDVPVQSVPEFLAFAKQQRDKLSIAFDTTAGAAAFSAKLFNRRADLGVTEVPYRSAAQMTQDVASGVDLQQRGSGDLVVEHAEAVEQKMVVPAGHSRRDAGVDQVRPAKQIDKAIAGGKVDPRLPFRIGHPRSGHLCNGHAHSLH